MIWGYIVLAYLSLFALGMADNVRGPLFPEILKSFSISDTQGAIYYATSSFCGFFGSLLVRALLQRWSRVRTLQFSVVLMTVGLVGMGLVSDFRWMLVFSGIFGASLGVVGVVQNVLVSEGSLPQKRQQMLSGLHATYGIASLLAPLAVAAISSWLGSWRYVFLIVSVVPGALLLGSAFWRDPQGQKKGEAKVPRVSSPVQSSRDHFGQIYLAVTFAFYVLAEIMVSTRLSLYTRRELHLDLQESSFYLTGFFGCVLAGRLLFTFFHFKWPLRHMLSVFLVSSAACISLGLTGHPLFLALSGFFMAPFYPLAMAYISGHYEKNMDSAISYCMAIQSFLTVAMHGVVGYLTDQHGISAALWVGPLALLVSFVLLNGFDKLFKKNL